MLNHSRFPNGRAHGFAALANIGVLRAGRAQPLYLLTPPGRFALRATAHRADASLRRAAGRFGPSAQVPTGHTLPFAPAGVWGRLPVAQSSRWALAAPAARFAPRLQVALAPSGPSAHRAHASFRRPKALCRSIFRERCERPKDARNAALSKTMGFSTV